MTENVKETKRNLKKQLIRMGFKAHLVAKAVDIEGKTELGVAIDRISHLQEEETRTNISTISSDSIESSSSIMSSPVKTQDTQDSDLQRVLYNSLNKVGKEGGNGISVNATASSEGKHSKENAAIGAICDLAESNLDSTNSNRNNKYTMDLNRAIELSLQTGGDSSRIANNTMTRREEHIPAGLRNTGNICYFNSIVQVLFHSHKGLRDAIIAFPALYTPLSSDEGSSSAKKSSSDDKTTDKDMIDLSVESMTPPRRESKKEKDGVTERRGYDEKGGKSTLLKPPASSTTTTTTTNPSPNTTSTTLSPPTTSSPNTVADEVASTAAYSGGAPPTIKPSPVNNLDHKDRDYNKPKPSAALGKKDMELEERGGSDGKGTCHHQRKTPISMPSSLQSAETSKESNEGALAKKKEEYTVKTTQQTVVEGVQGEKEKPTLTITTTASSSSSSSSSSSTSTSTTRAQSREDVKKEDDKKANGATETTATKKEEDKVGRNEQPPEKGGGLKCDEASDRRKKRAAISFVSELQRTFVYLVNTKRKFFDPRAAVAALLKYYEAGSIQEGSQNDVAEIMQVIIDAIEVAFEAKHHAPGSIKQWFYSKGEEFVVPLLGNTSSSRKSIIESLSSNSVDDESSSITNQNQLQRVNAKQEDDKASTPPSPSKKEVVIGDVIVDVGEGELHAALEKYTHCAIDAYRKWQGAEIRAEKSIWFQQFSDILCIQIQRVGYDSIKKMPTKNHLQFKFPKILHVDRYCLKKKKEAQKLREKHRALLRCKSNLKEKLKWFTNYKTKKPSSPINNDSNGTSISVAHDVPDQNICHATLAMISYLRQQIDDDDDDDGDDNCDDAKVAAPSLSSSVLTTTTLRSNLHDDSEKSSSAPTEMLVEDKNGSGLDNKNNKKNKKKNKGIASVIEKIAQERIIKVLTKYLNDMNNRIRELRSQIENIDKQISKLYKEIEGSPCYHLTAVMVHDGKNASQGHYWAYINRTQHSFATNSSTSIRGGGGGGEGGEGRMMAGYKQPNLDFLSSNNRSSDIITANSEAHNNNNLVVESQQKYNETTTSKSKITEDDNRPVAELNVDLKSKRIDEPVKDGNSNNMIQNGSKSVCNNNHVDDGGNRSLTGTYSDNNHDVSKSNKKSWLKFNDANVSRESEKVVFNESYGGHLHASAYCLIYTKNLDDKEDKCSRHAKENAQKINKQSRENNMKIEETQDSSSRLQQKAQEQTTTSMSSSKDIDNKTLKAPLSMVIDTSISVFHEEVQKDNLKFLEKLEQSRSRKRKKVEKDRDGGGKNANDSKKDNTSSKALVLLDQPPVAKRQKLK